MTDEDNPYDKQPERAPMSHLLRFSGLIDRINAWIGHLMGWVAVAMVIIGFVNVVARYAGANLGMQLSSNALLEAQTYAYNLVFLLGAAHVLRRNGHIRVDILHSGLSARGRAWVDILGTVLLLVPFCLLAIWFSWDYVLSSWDWPRFERLEQSPNPAGLPRYPIKTVIILAFVMILLQGISELIKRIAWLRGLPGGSLAGDERNGTGPEKPQGI